VEPSMEENQDKLSISTASYRYVRATFFRDSTINFEILISVNSDEPTEKSPKSGQ
jgi:hypothetical protein